MWITHNNAIIRVVMIDWWCLFPFTPSVKPNKLALHIAQAGLSADLITPVANCKHVTLLGLMLHLSASLSAFARFKHSITARYYIDFKINITQHDQCVTNIMHTFFGECYCLFCPESNVISLISRTKAICCLHSSLNSIEKYVSHLFWSFENAAQNFRIELQV